MTAVANVLNAKLNTNEDNEHLWLVLNLKGKAFSLSSINISKFVHIVFYQIEVVYCTYFYNVEICQKLISEPTMMDHVIFVLGSCLCGV